MKKPGQTDISKVSDHLANERTFLAWIRTGIAIMGLGFVVVKFALFLMQVTAVIGTKEVSSTDKSYSGHLGIALIALGLCTAGYAFYQYCLREKQLQTGAFSAGRFPALLLTIFILAIGLLLFTYLIHDV